jgi:hypothetical protein
MDCRRLLPAADCLVGGFPLKNFSKMEKNTCYGKVTGLASSDRSTGEQPSAGMGEITDAVG